MNINDNFQEIIEIEGYNKNISNNPSSDSDNGINEAFITNDIYTVAKLNKMKKDELEDICKKMKKAITKSKYTKKDLIDLIIKN